MYFLGAPGDYGENGQQGNIHANLFLAVVLEKKCSVLFEKFTLAINSIQFIRLKTRCGWISW